MRRRLEERVEQGLRLARDRAWSKAEALDASWRAFRRGMALSDVGGRGGGGRTTEVAQEAYAQSETSLELLAAAVMANGEAWAVADVCAALVRQGGKTSRPAVNSILWRGSRRADGKFALVSRGHYRIKTTDKAEEGTFPR